MQSGLKRSLACLEASSNEAAVEALLAALDHAPESIRFQALQSLLGRRSARAQRGIVRRWNTYPTAWHDLLREHASQLGAELQVAVLSVDTAVAHAAGQAAVTLHDYDLLAPLIEAIEEQPSHRPPRETLLQLVDCLYRECTAPRDYTQRRDPKLVRRYTLTTLEASVGRFGEHRAEEILEAFLALTGRENATLRSLLQAGRGEVHSALIGLFSRSQRPGVIRLLLSLLDDAHTPLIALKVIGKRTDPPFVAALLDKMQHDTSDDFALNLSRLETLDWLNDARLPDRWESLSEQAQQAAARLIVRSGIRPAAQRAGLLSLLNHGRAATRSVATASLAEFSGDEVNEIVLKLIDDPDPQVQACALVQLRQRKIPGALATLIKRLESPQSVVSNAARSCLHEFTFPRYLAAFDDMSAEVRRSTGALVRKVDPQAVPAVIEQLHRSNRSCRLRALEIAPLLGDDPRLLAAVIGALDDADHQVRAAAAEKLARFPEEASLKALRKMLADPSVIVQDAAERSLDQLSGTQVREEKSTIQWADLVEARLRAPS